MCDNMSGPNEDWYSEARWSRASVSICALAEIYRERERQIYRQPNLETGASPFHCKPDGKRFMRSVSFTT